MRHRHVAIVVFDGVQGLDVFGPADVFFFATTSPPRPARARCRTASRSWRRRGAARSGPRTPRIADLLAYVADHPGADLSIPALAARVNLSERSFQRLLTAETGISPGRYVERCRIDAARVLLEQTEEALAGIARRCGFGGPETSLRAFKRVVGVNPTEYRQRFPRYALLDTGGTAAARA